MAIIGLEIHGYLDTKEKLFCNCKSVHGAKVAKPNTYICPICTGQPGSKPMLPNQTALNLAIKTSLALGCKINKELIWQRKHYDWPDLPKGYQNTLSGPHAFPVGIKGKFLGIHITEAHLEEDPAAWNPKTGEIDYNRSGSPLIEIVTEPDFTSAEQVIDWLKQLTLALGYIKTIDKSAGLKADVNISLPELKGERIEVKNVNSLRNIKTAIEFEIQRQQKPGELPKHKETRMFDEKKGITKKMREKESGEDYRFISDPDLPVIRIEASRVEKLKSSLPETPQQKLEKLIKTHKIPERYARVLTQKLEVAEFFEEVIKSEQPDQRKDKVSRGDSNSLPKKEVISKQRRQEGERSAGGRGKNNFVDANFAAPWITIELLRALNHEKLSLDSPEVSIKPEHFAELLTLLKQNKITEEQAKKTINKFIPRSFAPEKEFKGKEKISNKEEIESIISKVIKSNEKAVTDFKSGNPASLNFLMGQAMKESHGRADIKLVKSLLEKRLR